jgi:hypothetical protein
LAGEVSSGAGGIPLPKFIKMDIQYIIIKLNLQSYKNYFDRQILGGKLKLLLTSNTVRR